MESLPAGEFHLELSSSGTEMGSEIATELDSPEVVEISSESEVEIVSDKIPTRALDVSQELLRMKDQERYGFLFRIEDRQAQIKEKLTRVKQEIEDESPEARQARRKSFQKAVFYLDS